MVRGHNGIQIVCGSRPRWGLQAGGEWQKVPGRVGGLVPYINGAVTGVWGLQGACHVRSVQLNVL